MDGSACEVFKKKIKKFSKSIKGVNIYQHCKQDRSNRLFQRIERGQKRGGTGTTPLSKKPISENGIYPPGQTARKSPRPFFEAILSREKRSWTFSSRVDRRVNPASDNFPRGLSGRKKVFLRFEGDFMRPKKPPRLFFAILSGERRSCSYFHLISCRLILEHGGRK